MSEINNQPKTEANHLLYSAIAEFYSVKAGFGDSRIAELNLLRVLKLNPNGEEATEAHNLLAQYYAQTRHLQKALKHFKAVLIMAPEQTIVAVTGLIDILEKQNKWKTATKFYNLGLTVIEDAGLHQGLAYCLAKLGNLEEAEYHGRRACELAPNDADSANDLGFILMEREKLTQAESYFNLALQMDPNHRLAGNNFKLCSRRILAK